MATAAPLESVTAGDPEIAAEFGVVKLTVTPGITLLLASLTSAVSWMPGAVVETLDANSVELARSVSVAADGVPVVALVTVTPGPLVVEGAGLAQSSVRVIDAVDDCGAVTVTVMQRGEESPPVVRVATAWPLESVVPFETMIWPELAANVTGTPGTAFLLLSVTNAVTVTPVATLDALEASCVLLAARFRLVANAWVAVPPVEDVALTTLMTMTFETPPLVAVTLIVPSEGLPPVVSVAWTTPLEFVFADEVTSAAAGEPVRVESGPLQPVAGETEPSARQAEKVTGELTTALLLASRTIAVSVTPVAPPAVPSAFAGSDVVFGTRLTEATVPDGPEPGVTVVPSP